MRKLKLIRTILIEISIGIFHCASDPHKNVHFSKLSSIEANLPDINKESAIVVSVIPGIDTAKIDPNKMARLQLKRPHTIRILQVI